MSNQQFPTPFGPGSGQQILGAVILFFIALTFFGQSAWTLLLFALAGYYLWRSTSSSGSTRRYDRRPDYGGYTTDDADEEPPSYVYEFDDDPAPPVRRADEVYEHALTAVRAAGLDPANTTVLPVDVGVMAFSADQEPHIHRTLAVSDDVDYIQPFVQLRLPAKATGRIRFEIVDSEGNTQFVHENNHEFQRGLNLITPAARLPIHDNHVLQGRWKLRISADGVLIAEHRFGWEESGARALRRHLREDGEISNELRALMAENRLETMSLDELLSEQEPQDAQQRRAGQR